MCSERNNKKQVMILIEISLYKLRLIAQFPRHTCTLHVLQFIESVNCSCSNLTERGHGVYPDSLVFPILPLA